MEEEALIKLQQEVSLNPQAVQLARLRMDLLMMRKLLRFSSNSVYAKREAAQAKGAGIDELTDGSERLDAESIEFVNGVVDNPLSLYLNEYNYGLMALKYYTYTINRKQRTVNLRSVFDALEKENVQFTPVEKEWMAEMKQLLATEEKEQHVDSVGRALVYEKYGDTQKEFDKKYAAMIERVYFDSYVNFDIAAVESLLGEKSEMLADLIRVQACCHHLETRYVPLSDVSLAQHAEKLADRKIFDLLVAENDALKATIAANKLKTGYTVNAVPRAEGDELFDAMLAKFRGKLVYVDFWATWCGPCRHGIKRIVPLKEEIENEEVVFVYITNQTSPLSTWENAIADIKGEHFRVSDDEWKVLKAKFNISGIPHYALVAKDGTLLNGDVPHYDNDKLKQLLESHL
jgi:thiol-disulfide isomerase/thioredoxin